MSARSSLPDPESIFDRWLSGEGGDIEELCRQYPAHANELKALWAAEEGIVDAMPSKRDSIFAPHRGSQPAPQRDEVVAARAGDTVGDFQLIEPLGRGGMGHVWVADQVSLKRRVALKLVRPERVNERALALFAREARAGGRLNHPAIVTVYGHGESNGTAWIAMELVEGAWTLRHSLDELMKLDELPEGYYDGVARFVVELADALQAAHQAGVIHRDLKPQNILISEADNPKLTDFGLARITDETAISVTGDFAGTYYYMSPEQAAAGRAGIDHRTDVFSLGIVMYEMLTLRRPFEGDTTYQVVSEVLTKDPIPPRALRSRVPADLSVICGKCLEKDRDRRYSTMTALRDDLESFLAREPIRARPPSTIRRAASWINRNKAVATLGAAALLMASLGPETVRRMRRLHLAELRAEEARVLNSHEWSIEADGALKIAERIGSRVLAGGATSEDYSVLARAMFDLRVVAGAAQSRGEARCSIELTPTEIAGAVGPQVALLVTPRLRWGGKALDTGGSMFFSGGDGRTTLRVSYSASTLSTGLHELTGTVEARFVRLAQARGQWATSGRSVSIDENDLPLGSPTQHPIPSSTIAIVTETSVFPVPVDEPTLMTGLRGAMRAFTETRGSGLELVIVLPKSRLPVPCRVSVPSIGDAGRGQRNVRQPRAGVGWIEIDGSELPLGLVVAPDGVITSDGSGCSYSADASGAALVELRIAIEGSRAPQRVLIECDPELVAHEQDAPVYVLFESFFLEVES